MRTKVIWCLSVIALLMCGCPPTPTPPPTHSVPQTLADCKKHCWKEAVRFARAGWEYSEAWYCVQLFCLDLPNPRIPKEGGAR